MGYEGLAGGTPLVMTGTPSNNNDGLLGGGLGGLLLGGLLFGQGGMGGMFGGNRGMGMNGGYGMGGYPAGGGFYAGNVEGGQTAGITALQGQLTALSSTVNSNQVSNQMSQISDVIVDGVEGLNGSLNSIARDLTSGQGNIVNAITNGNFATLQNLNALGRDAVVQSNNNALQQLNSFNQLSTTLNQGFNEVGRDSNIATSQIIAGQNAIAAQAAQCCCEIKQAIATDGGLTRALINDIRLSELNAQLTDCKLANSNLMQTNQLNTNNAAQTSTILQHLSPYLSGIQGALVEVNNVNRNTNSNSRS
jgi:hypothetical protein